MADPRYNELLDLDPSIETPPTYYEILGVPTDVEDETINASFKEQMKKLQQIKSSKHKGFIEMLKEELRVAKRTLTNAKKREKYDKQLDEKRFQGFRTFASSLMAGDEVLKPVYDVLVMQGQSNFNLTEDEVKTVLDELAEEKGIKLQKELPAPAPAPAPEPPAPTPPPAPASGGRPPSGSHRAPVAPPQHAQPVQQNFADSAPSPTSSGVQRGFHQQDPSGSGIQRGFHQQDPSGSGIQRGYHQQDPSGSGIQRGFHQQDPSGSGIQRGFQNQTPGNDPSGSGIQRGFHNTGASPMPPQQPPAEAPANRRGSDRFAAYYTFQQEQGGAPGGGPGVGGPPVGGAPAGGSPAGLGAGAPTAGGFGAGAQTAPAGGYGYQQDAGGGLPPGAGFNSGTPSAVGAVGGTRRFGAGFDFSGGSPTGSGRFGGGGGNYGGTPALTEPPKIPGLRESSGLLRDVNYRRKLREVVDLYNQAIKSVKLGYKAHQQLKNYFPPTNNSDSVKRRINGVSYEKLLDIEMKMYREAERCLEQTRKKFSQSDWPEGLPPGFDGFVEKNTKSIKGFQSDGKQLKMALIGGLTKDEEIRSWNDFIREQRPGNLIKTIMMDD